eukprot:3318694-Prymnesium_polylepis.1
MKRQGTELLDDTQITVSGIPIMPAFAAAAQQARAPSATEPRPSFVVHTLPNIAHTTPNMAHTFRVAPSSPSAPPNMVAHALIWQARAPSAAETRAACLA